MASDDNARTHAAVDPALTLAGETALRKPLFAMALVGLLLLVVPAVLFAGGTQPSRPDRWVQQLVGTSAGDAWPLVRTLDWLGEPLGRAVMTLAVTALCLLARRRALAVVAVAAVGAGTALTLVLKPVVDRRIHDDFLSYPSGHTAAGTAVGMILGLLLADLLKANRVAGSVTTVAAAVLGGGLMAWAQIILVAHYPTDTLGGFGCGLLMVAAATGLVDRLRRST
jgi:undecaprenyl-diphosphatase